jgi:hypothetical protein
VTKEEAKRILDQRIEGKIFLPRKIEQALYITGDKNAETKIRDDQKRQARWNEITATSSR